MLFIHDISCISPQKTFGEIDLMTLNPSSDNKLHAIEPLYKDIPVGLLRRMGKAVRLGVGAALPLLQKAESLDGIIIGTANGGMEDCIRFLNQIIEYDEGTLTPTNFVQSTSNAIASQIAFINKNKGYNITHVHRGLSFENALLDAMMKAVEDPGKTFLLGGLDEISDYNFTIDRLAGNFKREITPNHDLYGRNTEGTIAGEGAAMFIVNGIQDDAIASVKALEFFHLTDFKTLESYFWDFLKKNNIRMADIDLFLSSENGDSRYDIFPLAVEAFLHPETIVTRFKHSCGEFPSASALSLWYSCRFIKHTEIPSHMLKKGKAGNDLNRVLIFNSYMGKQHSFMLLEKV